jgi:uncharacterized membrane protein
VSDPALFVVVFLACLVEAVEALTIVLAAGLARGWRSALIGCVAGMACLTMVVAALGPAVSVIPLDGLRLFVGGLLLIFGLQWLRKAVLRASGNKTLHDEALVFAMTVAEARHRGIRRRSVVTDWYGFTLAFKSVTLEGLEVAFIVVTFGANEHNVALAAGAALVAVAAVGVAGTVLRAPLTRVPENTVKFVVGVLLTAFGLFWSVEGAGARWPGGDAAVLVVVPAVAAYAAVLVVVFRRRSSAVDLLKGVSS